MPLLSLISHVNSFKMLDRTARRLPFVLLLAVGLAWPGCLSSREPVREPAEQRAEVGPPPTREVRQIQPHDPVELNPETAAATARRIRADVTATAADGLQLDLWATEDLMDDPIAIDVDDRGDLYVTTSERSGGLLDIRGHPTWTTEALTHRSVDDLRAFLADELAPERSAYNYKWLPDFNQDGSHDVRDLTVKKERLHRIADRSGDGVADWAQVLVENFNDPETDVVGGLLVTRHGIYVSAAPHLWRLRDTTGDDLPDEMQSISEGYGVHPGFFGHGMSGIVVGPDGRIYWSVGDMGYNITGPDGRRWVNPYEGAVFRSEPDGTGFEVFARGLRNTHEFEFDKYGNIISVDNDGDHPGEMERIVYIVEGSDAGWRTHWQFGKYTDPDNNTYKVWMAEDLYKPAFAGQAAHITPPIANYHSGPAGMVYDPGTALSESWRDHFFVSEYAGSSATAKVHGFRLEEKGAGFDLASEKVAVSGILTVGMDWGPEGSLYLADWIEGWGSKGAGRIWKVSAAPTAMQEETGRLLGEDFTGRSAEDLRALLGHVDLRVRRKAQFELADRGAADVLANAARGGGDQMERLHGIWGIWQIARVSPEGASILVDLLGDGDAVVRAQAAKVLGDLHYEPASRSLLSLLEDENARVRFFAAEALGRIGYSPAFMPIVNMLARNGGEDVFLRHAGSLALARTGTGNEITALSAHPNEAVRLAAVVALRRRGNPGVAAFLDDANEFIVTDAARAINDDGGIPDALPALARTLAETPFANEPLLRRAISANLRIGTDEAAARLAEFAARSSAPSGMRAEALDALSVWARPSVLDRVDGAYLGPAANDVDAAREAAEPLVAGLLKGGTTAVQVAAARMAARLGLESAEPHLMDGLSGTDAPESRVAALEALFDLGSSHIEDAVRAAIGDDARSVRMAALRLIPGLELSDDTNAELLAAAVEAGSMEERQSALAALGELDSDETRDVLRSLVDSLEAGSLPPEIQLDLLEAVEATEADDLMERVATFRQARPADIPVSAYIEALHGGSPDRGSQIVFDNAAAQCMRCHRIMEWGGDVGPDLTTIGDGLNREQLLESLVDPSARIAPGYGTVSVRLENGDMVMGLLREEDDEALVLQTGSGDVRRISTLEITERTNVPSSMPPMGHILTMRQLRDVVAFLSTLKASSPPPQRD